MSTPDFKPVYIMGAGASKMLGAPLVNDFLSKANQLRYSNRFPPQFIEIFENVFDYQAKLFESRRYLKTNLENIEVLFSILEMDFQLKSDNQELQKVRDDLFTLIIKTLELSIEDNPEWGTYNRIIKFLAVPDNSTFLTFNYDLSIENALINNSYRIEYDLSDDINPAVGSGKFRRVLKLHGSANWIYCSQYMKKTNTKLEYCAIQSHDSENGEHKADCKCHLMNNLIIPPTWNKLNYTSHITSAWVNSLDAISTATHLFIIGYSFPRTDVFFDQLFLLALLQSKNLKKIIIVNNSADMEEYLVNSYFDDYFRPKIKFINRKFEYFNEQLPANWAGSEKELEDFISSFDNLLPKSAFKTPTLPRFPKTIP
ncbi:MAG: SIR2 family protein [Bacteroidota bacterium]